ncbi:MAG: hypothetical protein ACYSTL_05175 [Planctomycetota bacterium]|jgi:hypothetical protein
MAAPKMEKLTQQIATMDRDALVRTLRQLNCDFELDFTDEFLSEVSLERLRHIVTAALLHAYGILPAYK